MNTKPDVQHTDRHQKVVTGILKRIGATAIGLGFFTAICLLAAGRLNWIWPWVYLGINLVYASTVGPILIRTNPEASAERGEIKAKNKWDKIIIVSELLVFFIALPIVAGMDVRFGWTRAFSIAWHVAGAVVFATGLGLYLWAMMVNAYFSCVARVQSDRGQTVCSTGPYRFVRHPGYVGYILYALFLPILLGSLWALIPGIMAAVPIIIRTSLEDRMLQAELPGYRDYVRKVRHRLIPGIW